MPPIDASIPLGVKPPQLMTPMQAQTQVLSLKDLMLQTQLKDQQARQNALTLAAQTRMAEMSTDPNFYDPKTNTWTQEGIARIPDPEMRMRISKQQEELRYKQSQLKLEQNKNFVEQRKAVSGYLDDTVQQAIREAEQQSDPKKREEKFQEVYLNGWQEGRDSGLLHGMQNKPLSYEQAKKIMLAKEAHAGKNPVFSAIEGQKQIDDLKEELTHHPAGSPEYKAISDKIAIAQSALKKEVGSVTEETPIMKEAAALYGKDSPQYKKALAAHIAKMDAPSSTTIKLGEQAKAAEEAKKPLDESAQMARDIQAWTYLTSKTLPYRKGTGGGADRNDAVLRRAGEIATSLGMTPQEISAMPAEWKANAGSLLTQTKKLDAIEGQLSSFHNNLDTWDSLAKGIAPKIGGPRVQALAKDLKKVNFTGVRSVDDVRFKIEQEFNDPTVSALMVAAMAAAMDYGRIMQGPQSIASLSEGVRKDAERLIAASADEKGRKGIMAALESDTEGQVKGMRDQLKKIKTRMGGKSSSEPSEKESKPATSVPKGIPEGSKHIGNTPDNKKVWQSPDGKKWVE